MQQGGQGLIDEEAQHHIDGALAEGEGHIEHQKAVEKRVGGGGLSHGAQDLLVHADDGGQGQAVDGHIGRVDHEVVQGQGQNGHQHRPQHGAPNGVPAALGPAVEHAGHEYEHCAQEEVAQLAYAQRGAEGQVQQVFHQLDDNAVYGAQGEGAQQGGQVGDVQLHEGGHQRDRELDELQDEGNGGKHGGHRQAVGLFLLCGHVDNSF